MKKLLIVDDSVFMRNIINGSLRSVENLEVVGLAENGAVALEMVKEHQPDIVTLDITMPELDGIGFLKQVFELKKDINVIVATALKDKKLALEAVSLGASSFITKPFKPEDIVEEIKQYL